MRRHQPRPGRLIVICGLPGSGKTTLAKRLEREVEALRLCPDEWKEALGIDFYDAIFDRRLDRRLWDLAQELLRRGVTVVLEAGFWARAERDEKLAGARAIGALVELHFLDVPLHELWRRLERRNAAGERGTVPIPRVKLEQWAMQFEAPDAAELARFDSPMVSPQELTEPSLQDRSPAT